MNHGNGKRTLWGIFFLLAAGIVLLNATGMLPFEHISLWNMFWTIVFAAMFFSCLRIGSKSINYISERND